MAKQNRNTAVADAAIPINVEPPAPENPGLDDPGFALPEPHEWFDDEAMEEHHRWLGVAGRKLNHAMQAVVTIGVLADMQRASRQARDLCQPYLTVPQECSLIDAISLIANSVNVDLEETTEYFNKKLQEGGAE
jgi:hypothetical protein